MSTSEDVNQRISALEALVEKQSKLIAQTGQRLMEMQIKNLKGQLDSSTTTNQPPVDMSDYITNEDIVQLVTELQTQLDSLEDRTMRRVYNSTLQYDEETLAPIMNRDGELPEFAVPKTLQEFKDLSKKELIRLGVFYEIIVPNEQEVEQALEQDNAKDAILDISKNKDIEEMSKSFDDDQVNEIYDELARYFGIKHKRNSDGW
ncbi:conserved hypothetical protein [Candida tropicalis MYA-3404]|uniref:Mrp8p n=1 Tax=Candida tropicalis (strain ATCC MYA-3404 / T1) TaxID=294747 RepID=C5MCI3_CANTT|nr:conserved hypothetical protein [Candida tropicalis MYA-3404]XP_002549643.1 conserved hypothetical protein [Candida tropicalis MYA-3404]KAG4405865.1 hypothetical protein JTP64_004736 [Candida tropicalis]EER32263.1 conserved hypothetical protein [Candida tropicalis MYA-3404]EER32269.1 conserved hypothetical protein [Candida tropicalis MYA-3404]KAG4405871.1 hypothetical protein JTP64_004742 [Candida tropicalis]